jgi:hypothetical protein
MGVRKSYKRRGEFKSESAMWDAIRAYHDTVVHYLVGDTRPADRWKKTKDYSIFQESHLQIGHGRYILTTSFNDSGASNRVVRARSPFA